MVIENSCLKIIDQKMQFYVHKFETIAVAIITPKVSQQALNKELRAIFFTNMKIDTI